MGKVINLYVATAFNGGNKNTVAGWVRKNGNPHREPSGTKQLKKIGKKQAELVAGILSVSAALRDVPGGSKVRVYLDNEQIADALDNGDIRNLLKKAYRVNAKHFSAAAHGMLDECVRHKKVEAVHVNSDEDPEAARMLQKAYELAQTTRENINGHQCKKRKGRRGNEDRKAAEASLNDHTMD